MEEQKIIVINQHEYQTFIYSVISDIKEEIAAKEKLRNNTQSLRGMLSNKDALKRECKKLYILKYFKDDNSIN